MEKLQSLFTEAAGKSCSYQHQQLLLYMTADKAEDFEKYLKSCIRDNNFHIDDIVIKNKTLLQVACIGGCSRIVRLLLKYKTGQASHVDEWKSLHLAIELEYPDIVQLLLENSDTNPNAIYQGQTPLQLAVLKKSYFNVQVLLRHGANPNFTNTRKQTALNLAAISQNFDLAKVIVEEAQMPLDLDETRDYKRRTTREVVRKMLPKIVLPEAQEIGYSSLNSNLEWKEEKRFSRNFGKNVNLTAQELKNLTQVAAVKGLPSAMRKLMNDDRVKHLDFTIIVEMFLNEGNLEALKMMLKFKAPTARGYDLVEKAYALLNVPCEMESKDKQVRKKCYHLVCKYTKKQVGCIPLNKSTERIHFSKDRSIEERAECVNESTFFMCMT